MMDKIIVGIHGLSNKPPRECLQSWWEKSIREGLRKNCQMEGEPVHFRLVYTTDLIHKIPKHNDRSFHHDLLFDDEPYYETPSEELKTYNETTWDLYAARMIGVSGTNVDSLKSFFGMDMASSWFLQPLLHDMEFYYSNEWQIPNRNGQFEPVRKVLRDDLKNTLREERDKQITLIAHGMGSVIAYDVLRDLDQEDQTLKIEHFITLGSPLGLPHIKGKIIEERRSHDERLRTPSCVTGSWMNFADRRDPMAIDFNLTDDFVQNDYGIRIQNILVANDYRRPHHDQTFDPQGRVNSHKAYGYLRCPEVTQTIRNFVLEGVRMTQEGKQMGGR